MNPESTFFRLWNADISCSAETIPSYVKGLCVVLEEALCSLCCCFRFGVHYFLGAVCCCLCLVFALCVLLLLVVACGEVRHFFCCFLHWFAVRLRRFLDVNRTF
jgi:hypothetical protein